MPVAHWTLFDTEQGLYQPDFQITQAMWPALKGEFSVRLRRLRGGLQEGVDLLEIDNGRCRVDLLPTRGMGIHRAWVRGPAEIKNSLTPVGWRSPVRGPVHPQFVPLMEPAGLGWLDGFDELLVRCGLESNGPPVFDPQGRLQHPLHGRIANRPAHKLEVSLDTDAEEIRVSGVAEETRFLFQKLRLTSTFRMRLGEPEFQVSDEVTNLSATPAEMQLLYHINFGAPLLEPNAEVVLPVRKMVPRDQRVAEALEGWNRYGAGTAGFSEQVYFFTLAADAQHRTQALLKNASETLGASLLFDVRQLPCFTLWKNTQAGEDGYVTGLEPGTNFPNPRDFEKEQGRVLTLAPGESRTFDLKMQFHASALEVKEAVSAIGRLQEICSPTRHRQPQPGWCVGV